MTWKDIFRKAFRTENLNELSDEVKLRYQNELRPLLGLAGDDDPLVLGKAWEIVTRCQVMQEVRRGLKRDGIWYAALGAGLMILSMTLTLIVNGRLSANDLENNRITAQREAAARAYNERMAAENRQVARDLQGKLASCESPGLTIEVDEKTQTQWCVPSPYARWEIPQAYIDATSPKP